MIKLIDSHCHLSFPDFSEDIQDVLGRAKTLGIHGFLNVSTKVIDASALEKLSEAQPNIWHSVGLHPHDTQAYDLANLRKDLLSFAKHSKAIALGETGLDYYYDHSPRKEQRESFVIHIESSLESQLPLIIHTRDADEDTISILKQYDRVQGVFHCFSGSLDLAQQALDLGFFISLSGIITFKNANALREVAQYLPLEKILVETDSPFLAPIPYRGKRNEPAYLYQTAECLANLKQLPFEEIARITTQNFFKLFSKASQNP
jgi:TatD DNase family protein